MNPKTTFIYTWNTDSIGVKLLKKALGIRALKRENSKYFPSPNHTIINWGCSEMPQSFSITRIINKPEIVAIASNKLSFFEHMSREGVDNPRLPEFTTSKQEAIKLVNAGHTVLARTLLRASSGDGIYFLNSTTLNDWINAGLYVVYKKKKEEFRVHFVLGQQVDVQKKALRVNDPHGNPIDRSAVDTRIRNRSNGYIFARNDIVVPPDVITQATKAYKASGLDFCSIDVIWNEHEQKAYVLEANTASGMEGTTVDNYSRAFQERL